MAFPIIPGPLYANNLQSGIGFSNGTGPSIQTGTVNPSTTATDGVKGSLYLNSNLGAVYIKNDNGTTTNWTITTGSTPVIMRAYVTGSGSASAGTNYPWDTVQYDTASSLNAASGQYTIPYSDYYHVNVSALTNTATDIFVAINGSAAIFVSSLASGTNLYGNGTCLQYFNAGDIVSIQPNVGSTLLGGPYSYWEIFRVPASAIGGGGGSGITRSVITTNTPTTAGAVALTDYVYNVSGTTTITLPTAVGNSNRYSIKNVGTNTVTVVFTSGQTADGSSSVTLPLSNMSLDFVSNNTNWTIE